MTESFATVTQAAQAIQVDLVDLAEQASQVREAATASFDTTPIGVGLTQLCRFAVVYTEIIRGISSSPALADVIQLGEFLVDKEVAAKVTDDEEKEKPRMETASSAYSTCCSCCWYRIPCLMPNLC